MPDAKRWIADIKREEPPELWSDVERRTKRDPIERRSASTRRPLLAAAILTVCALVLGSTLYGLGQFRVGIRDHPSQPPSMSTPDPTETEAATPRIELSIGDRSDVGGWVVLADPFGVWVAGAGSLHELDPRTGMSHQSGSGGWDYDHVDLAEWGEGAIFVVSGTTLWGIDAHTGDLIVKLDPDGLGYLGAALRATSGTWVTASDSDGGDVLARIDEDTGAVLKSYSIDLAENQIVEAAGYLFVSSQEEGDGAILRIDPSTDVITPAPIAFPGALVAVGSNVWVASGDSVTCIDALSLDPCGRVEVPRASSLASEGRNLWVLSLTGSTSEEIYLPDPDDPATVTLINGETGEVLSRSLPLPDTSPASISAFDGHAWVGFHDSGQVIRVDACGSDRSCPR